MTGAVFAPPVPLPKFTSMATFQELGWWMPLFLFLGGWFTYLSRTNMSFEIGTMIATVIACRSVYLLVVKCRDVRFTWVTGCGLLLGYGLGSLNTALQLAKKGESIAEHFSRSQDDLSIAFSLVLWISGTLFLAGAIIERPIRLDQTRLLKTDISYVYLGIVIYLGALATGQIGYMGATVSDDHHVTVAATIAGIIGPTLPALTVLLRRKAKLLRPNLLFWAVLLGETVMLVPSGRRMIIYSLFCVVLAFTLTGDRWRSPLWKKALLIVVCLTGVYIANVVFYAMRYSAIQSGAAKKMGGASVGLSELVSNALKFLKDGRDSSFDQDMAANLQDRTFVLPYFSDLVMQSRTHTPLHGRLLLFDAGMAVPSAVYSLYGDKSKLLETGIEEYLVNPDFGLAAQDEANSLLTGGVSDFGVVGAFVYPIVLSLLINFVIRVGLSRATELMKFIALLMFLDLLFQTEMSVSTLIISLRNLGVLLLVWMPVEMIARFFIKPSPNRVPNQLDGRRLSNVVLVRYEAASRIR